MRRLLREPLLHFLALGALLFALYGWINRGGAPDDEQRFSPWTLAVVQVALPVAACAPVALALQAAL